VRKSRRQKSEVRMKSAALVSLRVGFQEGTADGLTVGSRKKGKLRNEAKR
jgi:hypothetical protein